MNPGDKVECIDPYTHLTPGKLYVVQPRPVNALLLSDTLFVTNDGGHTTGYLKRRFKMSARNFIREVGNKVEFTLQDGPIKENGVNGCQVDDALKFFRDQIQSFQNAVPCRENEQALLRLDETLMWLDKRKRDRETRGVEGTSSR